MISTEWSEEMVPQNPQPIQQNSASFDGYSNWKMYNEQSKNTKARTVFPSDFGVKAINPNAKPFKLNPPK